MLFGGEILSESSIVCHFVLYMADYLCLIDPSTQVCTWLIVVYSIKEVKNHWGTSSVDVLIVLTYGGGVS